MTTNSEPIKLVHIVTSPMTACSFLRGQLRFMRERGMEVTVIASPAEALHEFAQSEGVNSIAVPMPHDPSPVRHSMALVRLYRILRSLRPHIVHTGTPHACLLGGIAATAARTPVRVMTLHGIGTKAGTSRTRPVFRFLETLSCRMAQRIYCVGDSLRAQAIEMGLAPPEKLRVLAAGTCNGIEVERLARTPDVMRRVESLRERLKLPSGVPVIGFVGRMVRSKGIAELMAAFRRLKGEFSGLRLLLVGPFEDYERLGPELYDEMKHDPQIVAAGYIKDMPSVYPLMTVMTLPSYREGFPYVPMEAAAMQVPSVATRIVGCADAVVDGVTGTLVPLGDVEALAGALRTYLLDPELCRRHGDAGRARVVRDFRPEPIWEALYGEYMELLKARGVRDRTPPVEQKPRQRLAEA